MSADGAIIDVSLVKKPVPVKEQSPIPQDLPGEELSPAVVAPPPIVEAVPVPEAEPEPVLTPTSAASLLSRIGGPAPTAKVNGKKEARSKASKPASLEPYTELLNKAGVKDIDYLRKLVRKSTVTEYVEMLAREYPDEVLLKGLTGMWALRERLEEWLGVKERSTFNWGTRLNGSV